MSDLSPHQRAEHQRHIEEAMRRIEEVDAAREEETRRAIQSARRRAQESRRRREAEAEKRRRQIEEQREAEAKARLEAERQRQYRLWISCGNPAEEFEAAWPQIKQEVLMERRRAQAQSWKHLT